MKEQSPEELERLIAAERGLPPPEHDWRHIERRIRTRLERTPRRPEPARLGRPLAAGAALALAAAGVLLAIDRGPGWLAAPQSALSVAQPARPAAVPAHSAEGPSAAAAGETTAELANAVGRARWQLGPDGQASAQRDGRGLLLRLTEGSIEVEVDPGDDPEQVTVAAGDVRVVVHGTKFRVEHLQETVNVTVHEGVVAVSAPAVPRPVRLAAPSSTNFASKEGARQRDSGPTPASPLPPVEPSIGDVENAVARLQQAAQGCFERHTTAASGVQVTARTNVVLAVQPNGTATARAFDPPLSPAVQGCTRAALSAIRLAPSQRGIEVTRALDLGR